MAEKITITQSQKNLIYNELIPQINAVVESEKDVIANLANIAAMIKEVFNYFWVGFYIVKSEQLVLGPFQGTLACTRIKFGKGVCGKAWENKETIIVPDVDQFPGHIACSDSSKSEIVVPVIVGGTVVAVIDVDSDIKNSFDVHDQNGLEKIASIVSKIMQNE